MFVCAVGSRRGYPARLSILHVDSVRLNKVGEGRNNRRRLNVNDQLAFQEAKGTVEKTPVRFAFKPHVPASEQEDGILDNVLMLMRNTTCSDWDSEAFAGVYNVQSRIHAVTTGSIRKGRERSSSDLWSGPLCLSSDARLRSSTTLCAGQTQVLICLRESVEQVRLSIWSRVLKKLQSCSPIWYETLGKFGTKLLRDHSE